MEKLITRQLPRLGLSLMEANGSNEDQQRKQTLTSSNQHGDALTPYADYCGSTCYSSEH